MEHKDNDDASVDVQALQREVALLKTLLHQERAKSSSSSSQRELSPTRPASPSKASVTFNDTKDESSPRKSVPMTISSSSQRARSMRYGNGRNASTERTNTLHAPLESQLEPIDTKRGKWWLKDRQVLSRNAPSPTDDVIAMKVRETWLWSGRTVIVDKIVTYAAAPAHHESDDDDVEHENDAHNRPESFVSATAALESGVSSAQASSIASLSPSKPPTTAPEAAVAVAASESPLKQLAHEFLQPMATDTASSASAVDLSDPTARMEHQMAIAAQEAAAAPQTSSDER